MRSRQRLFDSRSMAGIDSLCFRHTNCLIREPLPNDALQRAFGALCIVNAKLHAVVIAKIELGDVAMQMLLAAMLVDAFHAALENRIVAFYRVRVDRAAHVFIGLMAYAFMAREVLAERKISAAFVGHHRRFLCHIGLDDRDYIGCARSFDMERANLPAATIDK